MKKTNLSWVCLVLELFFLFVIPCGFIWAQYGDLAKGYKISATAIILTACLFAFFKRIFLDGYLKKIEAKIANIETNALTITDETAIAANKKEWQTLSLIQLLSNAIVPVLLAVFAVQTIKVVETGLIKLYGCLMCASISVVIGLVFKIIEVFSYQLKHEKGKDK